MNDSILSADNGVTRRGFMRRASLLALGSVATIMGAPAVSASARRQSDASRASDVRACAQFCSPASNCGNAGCGSGKGLFHCVGCGQDFYHCYSHGCGTGFCRLPDC